MANNNPPPQAPAPAGQQAPAVPPPPPSHTREASQLAAATVDCHRQQMPCLQARDQNGDYVYSTWQVFEMAVHYNAWSETMNTSYIQLPKSFLVVEKNE